VNEFVGYPGCYLDEMLNPAFFPLPGIEKSPAPPTKGLTFTHKYAHRPYAPDPHRLFR
jgi:hypothetical protein